MNEISFQNLPIHYQAIINGIQDKNIQRIYDNFHLFFFHFDIYLKNSIKSDFEILNDFENFLYNYLKTFTFITCHFTNIDGNITKNESKNSNETLSPKTVNAVICVEGKCLIIEKIIFSLIDKIIFNLKEQKVAVIYTNRHNCNDKTVNEEIKNFYRFLFKKIQNNDFIQKTIKPIIGFLIRRYYYPTSYFDDPSFFSFKNSNFSIEKNIQTELSNFYKNENELNTNIKENIIDCINKYNDNTINAYEFKETDFVILRNLYKNKYVIINLVIHLESFYIFAMKTMINPSHQEFKHEIDFCEHFSHRCLTRFYGFVKREGKLTGFIYEFMSNDSLSTYVISNNEKINETFYLNAINKIIQGIKYLHSNSLIHRDLKPSNILIDHDFNIYISDFETIRHIIKEGENEEMTNDIGTPLYSSPEQYYGKNISYPTDIYSFGLTIYFLVEKRQLHSLKGTDLTFQEIQIHFQNDISDNLQSLIKRCISFLPTKRPSIKEIESIITDEIKSFSYLEKYLLKDTASLTDIIQFISENILIQKDNQEQLKNYLDRISLYHSLIYSKFNEDNSSFLNSLGKLYQKGDLVEQDFSKARSYYELAIKQNNPKAFFNLGYLYEKSYGVNQDYILAREYYDSAAKLNNVDALNALGDFYRDGHGVKQDFDKAKEYYELTAKQNNADGFNKLGYLYVNGFGVKQDYEKAMHYYQIATNLNNSYAPNYIGDIYKNGKGVKQDYAKAKEYYEISAKLNNPEAFNSLGYLYEKGYGVKQDYVKAREYYEAAAKLNNSYSLNYLGNLYENGYGVPKDYSKAIEYYEQSAKLNNSSAYCYLAYIYYNGLGVCRDLSKAFQYIVHAAKLNNSTALNNLGKIYFHGFGVQQNYSKAKEYYELAVKQNNSTALINLGYMYEKGLGVQLDFLKAKEYYELSAKQNNSIALFKLGNLYRKGKGVEQDLFKALDYYYLSSQHHNISAYFYLGYLNSIGEKIDVNISKSIYFYLKCNEIHIEKAEDHSSVDNHAISIKAKFNKYYYHSLNDLGLIYLTYFEDVEKAIMYIKESAFGEYPFGQNNYGLLNQFYLNHKGNAKYLYERSSNHKFALAYFNLANLYEEDGEIDEAIKNYILASEYENEPLIFHDHHHKDRRLEISKLFIICFTNLKLMEYYFSLSNFDESKKYLFKSFSTLNEKEDTYTFHFKFDNENSFSYLKDFILNYPLFNMMSYVFQEDFINEKSVRESSDYIHKKNKIVLQRDLQIEEMKIENIIFKNPNLQCEEAIFDDIGSLFNFVIKNKKLRNDFINVIKNIIQIMKTILYTPPYSILFGRINLTKTKQNQNQIKITFQQNINNLFYTGFGHVD